jgi:putative ABC transport system substrate-binding protein
VVRDINDLAPAFEAATTQRAAALLTAPGPIILTYHPRIVELAAAHRLPAMYHIRDFVAAGGLLAYGANAIDLWRRLATYVDKILKGARPADLPVEQATTFDFFVNLATAQALGLTIPPSILMQATEVIH